MKILYAVQGTGNGHLMRAAEMVPAFRALPGISLDVLISGTQHELPLPFDVRYRLSGLSFVFGKAGGIDYFRTLKMLSSRRFIRDVINLPVREYDLVISDFEPVASRAAMLRGVPCVALSNQAAVLHPQAPKPSGLDPASKFLLRHYAPAHKSVGFHYQPLDDNIFTPLIRQRVRNLKSERHGHYCLYLPAYSDENILKTLRQLPRRTWHVFSKKATSISKHGSIYIFPVDGDRFLESMAGSDGVVCNAGFGTTSEALFLGKKMLVIPMKRQCEQQCNAAMLSEMGIEVFGSFHPGNAATIEKWLCTGAPKKIDFPDHKNEVMAAVLAAYQGITSPHRETEQSQYFPVEWTMDLMRGPNDDN